MTTIFNTEKGSSWLSGLFTLLILTMVFLLGIEIACYFITYGKLRVAANETMALMKLENGFDSSIEQYFYDFLKIQGLDPLQAQVKVKGTPTRVQRGEILTLKTEMPYQFRALRPMGREYQLTLRVTVFGLAQEFIR